MKKVKKSLWGKASCIILFVLPLLLLSFLVVLELSVSPSQEDRVPECYFNPTSRCNDDKRPLSLISCNTLVPGEYRGYCVFNNNSRIMTKNCNTVARIKCNEAPLFKSFQTEITEILNQDNFSLPPFVPKSRAILLSSNEASIIGVYAIIKLLRSQGCQLPIELWIYKGDLSNQTLTLLNSLNVSIQILTDRRHKDGWFIKPFIIYSTKFDQILMLDADNVPTRDPTYLFDSKEFKETGALFWPDYWHPKSTLFGLNSESLLWELFEIPFVDMFEQESGQLLIDKSKSLKPLEILRYMIHNDEIIHKQGILHGDKDFYRFAWLKSNKSFFMAQAPDSAGEMKDGAFCGGTIVQYDPNGEIVFFHRNKGKFNDADKRKIMWTAIQKFNRNLSTTEKYRVMQSKDICFGSKEGDTNYEVVNIEDTPYADLEENVLDLVKEFLEVAHPNWEKIMKDREKEKKERQKKKENKK